MPFDCTRDEFVFVSASEQLQDALDCAIKTRDRTLKTMHHEAELFEVRKLKLTHYLEEANSEIASLSKAIARLVK